MTSTGTGTRPRGSVDVNGHHVPVRCPRARSGMPTCQVQEEDGGAKEAEDVRRIAGAAAARGRPHVEAETDEEALQDKAGAMCAQDHHMVHRYEMSDLLNQQLVYSPGGIYKQALELACARFNIK